MSMLSALATRMLHLLPPEPAHELAMATLRRGIGLPATPRPDPKLAVRLWERDFPSPLGLAAGFDKDGVAIDSLLKLGFGFVEIGSITPRPQPGNPRPRLFRLSADKAVINRMGFNNDGVAAVAARVASWRSRIGAEPGILGVNLGKNKDSTDAAADYAVGAARFARLADYLVINVSSPNTPGLRALQSREQLAEILERTRTARDGAADSPLGLGAAETVAPPPLLVKVAPDLTEGDIEDIAALARDGAMDGLIVSNTTLARPEGLRGGRKGEAGGLSGRPLFAPSTRLLARFHQAVAGKVPLIGVGGVFSADEAWAKIKAGASLVQVYTGLIYRGPDLVQEILAQLPDLMAKEGVDSLAEAVGRDAARQAAAE